jgi:sirohydrochlorin ferrochelatase
MTTPVLVACAHGTRNASGRRLIAELALTARRLRPGLVTTAAFVDVQPPTVVDVVAGLAAEDRPAVVVPLLLSGGYHVHVDIAGAVAAHPRAVAARPLGPDERLVQVLHDRLLAVGAAAHPGTAVVLAAAGSSDPRSVADVERTAALLQERWAGPVTPAYGSAAAPSVPEAVTAARAAGASRVVVAAYLLAPGHFADRLAAAGADAVTAPLLPDDRVAAVLLDRYDAARPR